MILLIWGVYGIWEDLGTWKILLRCVPMICFQFWEFSKMTQNREVSTFFSAAGFCPKQFKRCYLPAKAPPREWFRLLPKPGCKEIGFRRFPWILKFYTITEAHKQYSLLDTIFNYIFDFGHPGKHLYLSPKNPLHVGRRSRPACSRFSFCVCL